MSIIQNQMHEKRKAKAIIVGILLRVKRDDGRRCSGNVNMRTTCSCFELHAASKYSHMRRDLVSSSFGLSTRDIGCGLRVAGRRGPRAECPGAILRRSGAPRSWLRACVVLASMLFGLSRSIFLDLLDEINEAYLSVIDFG